MKIATTYFLVGDCRNCDHVHCVGHSVRKFYSPDNHSFYLTFCGNWCFVGIVYGQSAIDMIALIGIILLIGLVKKNGIMMVDFALAAQRHDGLSPQQAIYQAALMRFRPILMTTLAALVGAIPLMLHRVLELNYVSLLDCHGRWFDFKSSPDVIYYTSGLFVF
jgi:hypothetical protein